MADLKADPSVDRLVASMADSMVVHLAGLLDDPMGKKRAIHLAAQKE